MVKVRQYHDYWQALPAIIPGIKTVLLVSRDDELSGKIKNYTLEQFPLLVVVIPSADGQGKNVDNVTDKHTSLVYVLKKFDIINQTDENQLNDLEETQDIIETVKKKMINDASVSSNILYRLDLNSLHTDPEYNYLGCHGWSLGFSF